MHSRCTWLATVLVACLATVTSASTFEGWIEDTYLSTYETAPPAALTGSAHLPAIVRVTVDENAIAVIGWDLFIPERDEILLSMLLSTTWESPMLPWQGSDEWFVSSFEMPMSDGTNWRLWYRDTGNGTFELGAPPMIAPNQTPDYAVADLQGRAWSFTQSFLVVPEPASGVVLLLIAMAGMSYRSSDRAAT